MLSLHHCKLSVQSIDLWIQLIKTVDKDILIIEPIE